MNAQKFEQICRESKMIPLEKRVTPGGNVLLARKVARPEGEPAHYETLWAIERDGLDVAGIVKSPLYREHVLGAPSPTTIDECAHAAMEQAKQFIADSTEVGRYK